MDIAKLSVLLPDSRRLEVIECNGSSKEYEATIRVDLNSADDIKDWLSEMKTAISGDFILRTSAKPKKAKLYRLYVCSLASKNKTRPITSASVRPDLTERNYGCGASMAFWIMEGDDYALNGMAGKVQMNWRHNHCIDTAHYLSLLRPLENTKEKFCDYFDNGHSVNDAIELNQKSLRLVYKENVSKYLASKAYSPSKNTVCHWYREWREDRFGTWTSSYEALTAKMQSMTDLGVIVRLSAEPFAVLIVTPIMRRAHSLPSALDICFVDSTSTCDAAGHSITFMLTATCVGAVPLAIFITSNQMEKSYAQVFYLLKEALGEEAFGGTGCPKIFLTDDSIAERKALATVWPGSDHKNCIFHIAQAQWRWLFETKNKVKQEHRQQMMNDFRRIMFSVTDVDAIEAYTTAITKLNELGGYGNCIQRLNSLWERRIDWVIAYRDHHSRGNFTNNFAEITVRIFKDNILHRRKSYNAASLADVICTDLEDYYRSRLVDFSNCRSNSPFLKMDQMLEKAAYVSSKDIIQVLGNGVYLVPSESSDKDYEVDTTIGCCSCRDGIFGKFCKHAAVVLKYFGVSFLNCPAVSGLDRHRMAVIALGNDAPPPNFFRALNEANDSEAKDVAAISTDSQLDTDVGDSTMEVEPTHSAASSQPSDLSKAKKLAMTLLQVLLDHPDNEELAAAADRFSMTLDRCQGQSSRVAALLNSASASVLLRNRAGSKIPVQPTAKSRRKNAVTRGTSSRLAAGRVPASLSKKPKCGRVPMQRLRNLGKAIRDNRPNAKSHS